MTGNVFTAEDNPVADAGSGSEEETYDAETDGDSVCDCRDCALQPTTRLTAVRDHRVFRGRLRWGGMGARCGAVHSAWRRKSSRGMSSTRTATFGEAGIYSRR